MNTLAVASRTGRGAGRDWSRRGELPMKARCVALSALLLACFALSAAAQKDKDEKPKDKEKPKAYKTPQEVFDAFLTSLNKRDAKTFVACVDPDTLDQVAAFYAVQGLQRRQRAEGGTTASKLAKLWKPTLDVLNKHGLTAKATKDVKLGKDPSPAELAKAHAAVLPLLKDKAGFIVDYQNARDTELPKAKEDDLKAKLRDVKINGDKATGTMVVTISVKEEKKDPVEFVKVGGGWKIVPYPKKKDEGKDKEKKDKAAKDG
jgi:hypothetical protein